MAFIAIPGEKLWDALKDCAGEGVRGIVIITAGLGEAMVDGGKEEEEKITLFGKRNGIRIRGDPDKGCRTHEVLRKALRDRKPHVSFRKSNDEKPC